MLQHQAFIGGGKMLKGCLHCHTTRSDGVQTPEETMRIYKDHGYDFLAITDHRLYNYKNYLPELGLTIIPGMEYDNGHISYDDGMRCFHIVSIGPSQGDGNGVEGDVRIPSAKARDQEEMQPYLDDLHEKNNLTIYCHPQWSGTSARFFEKMKGHFAMEIFNTNCDVVCDMDNDAAYWDELLGQGIKIYGVATDDCHFPEHHCKGWVMVRAENNVNAILQALKEGAFYSSTGPEIYNFYIEDGKAIIDCSAAAMIRLQSDKHPSVVEVSEDGTMTHAEFSLKHWAGPYAYIRLSVVDKNGKKAWTNPIFLK